MKAISNLAVAWFAATILFCVAPNIAQENSPVPLVDSTSSVNTSTQTDTVKSADKQISMVKEEDQEPEEDEENTGEMDQPALSFLLPADGDVIYSSDVKIVAFVQGPTPSGMLAVLDGFSVERPLQMEEKMLTLNLPDMRPGVHDLKILFLNSDQKILLSKTVRFFVRIPEPRRKPNKGRLRQYGRVFTQLEWKGLDAQSQIVKQSKIERVVKAIDTTVTGSHDSLVIGKGETPLSQNLDGAGEVNYALKYDRFEGHLKGLLRTDENEFRQPSHRFSGRMAYGPWAMVRGGDIFPVYNELILNGTRIRGGEVNFAAVTDEGQKHWVYAKAVTGETRREIQAYVAQYDTGNGSYRNDSVAGSPSQKLTAIRLGAGGGETFDLGFTLMKATEQTQDTMAQAVNQFLHGIQPVENLVSGFDLRVGLWQGRIQLYGTFASSLFTRDKTIKMDSSLEKYRSIFVANSSTRGWHYLTSDSATDSDLPGFMNAISSYEAGVTASIPIAGIVTETEIRYSHLGESYHSEGNPFLGTNPGDGWSLQQRLVVLDNRLFFGVEVSSFLQEIGLYKQDERTFRGEIRYIPGAYRPSIWINGGTTARVPRGSFPYQFSQSFDQMNVGGFHQMRLGAGTIHGSLLYGLTRSELKLISNFVDTSIPLQLFPTALTHIVNSVSQYKFRGSDLTPKLSYTYANNGVQQPTSNIAVGIVYAFFNQQLRVDFDVLLGQYPKTITKNDLSYGENFSLIVRVGENQNVRFREKWVAYGSRTNISAGAYYEMFF